MQSANALHIDTAFDRALAGAQAREAAGAALCAVREIKRGEVFIRDCAPHELCVCGSRVPLLEPGEVVVVVVACQSGDNPEAVGRVFTMQGHHTVRRAEIVAPLKVRVAA